MKRIRIATASICAALSMHTHAFGPEPDVSVAPDAFNRADYSVKIVSESEADETWFVTGACQSVIQEPDEIVRFIPDGQFSTPDKTIAILTGYNAENTADRKVCMRQTSAFSHTMKKKLTLPARR
ncbi:hypothetical protein [Marinobacter salarius]|uniref:Uncharacterized protein n=1 Tax=Marinobacter salarius TaxID=1420917 RepID=A0A1W6KFT6_9GAMM|nr:hypothetical protein [Marinobacter salarius]ARM86189.1 hypothetical protein MARSALSMR5_04169 [Marinobacter salarius]